MASPKRRDDPCPNLLPNGHKVKCDWSWNHNVKMRKPETAIAIELEKKQTWLAKYPTFFQVSENYPLT